MGQGRRETMAWQRKGRLVVTLHTDAVPKTSEWAEYMAQADSYLPLEGQRILVVSAGGAPNSAQRRVMTDLLKGAKVPVAILTNSWLMRSSGIAVSWFNPSLKIFAPDKLDAAFEHLELTPWERTESAFLVTELQRELGVQVVESADVA